MRHMVTLEKPTEAVTSGEPSVPWPVQATVWAQMEGLSGSDRTGIVSETSFRFRIRHRADITPRWRLGLVGTVRKFQIFSLVDPDGRRREQIIIAQEMTA
jgi:SPP1 family predicted phage head-tail adaptor